MTLPGGIRMILFGAGFDAEKFIINHKNENIDFIVDDDKKGFLFDIPIIEPSYLKKINKNHGLIVVTANKYKYYDIRKQLIEWGFIEFKDFIKDDLYQKKIAMIWGNCHVEYIKEYLKYNTDFNKIYSFYDMREIWVIKKEDISRDIFSYCDLLIYQPIQKFNMFGEEFSSDHIISLLPETAHKISVPNLFGLPKFLYMQYDKNKLTKIDNVFVSYGDKNIDSWIKAGISIETMIKKIEFDEIYKDYEIHEAFNKFKKKLVHREKEWDIKISDYILYNYKKIKLFLDPFHPSKILLNEISKRLLKYMKFTTEDYDINYEDYGFEMIVYPCVKKHLGIVYDDSDIKNDNQSSKLKKSYMDLKEYIREYVELNS